MSARDRRARLHGAFGTDRFGRLAEGFARAFGTPTFIIVQTLFVVAWITINATAIVEDWDPYPFILLNLAFSTQAAYAAPLILLAQTRQADRDHVQEEMLEQHRNALASVHDHQLAKQAALLESVERLADELRTRLPAPPPADGA